MAKRSLKLDTTKTYVDWPLGRIKVSARECVKIFVHVVANNILEGSLRIIWDSERATIIKEPVTSELPSGTYERDFEWVLEVQPAGGATSTRIEIEARAGSLVQKTSMLIEILGVQIH